MNRIEARFLLIFQTHSEDGLIYAIMGTYLLGKEIENSLRNILILGLLSNLLQVKQTKTFHGVFSDINKMTV